MRALWNTLTLLVLALTLATVLCVAIIFINPQVPFNVLAPATLPVVAVPATDAPGLLPEATSTLAFPTLPPEWTATPTRRPATATRTQTVEPSPTETEAATETPTAGGTRTRTPTPGRGTPTRTPTRAVTATATAAPPTATPRPGNYPAPGTPTDRPAYP